VEQVAVLSPAAPDRAVGELPFAPAVVYRQVAETEFAQLFLLHLFQPLSGRHFLEHLAFQISNLIFYFRFFTVLSTIKSTGYIYHLQRKICRKSFILFDGGNDDIYS
jgi:hypothetical protein